MNRAQRIKQHRCYTVSEAARLLAVDKRTVRRWLQNGLPNCDEHRPILVLGRDLKEFLRQQRARKARTCSGGELYCVACRMPKKPAGKIDRKSTRLNSSHRL